MLMDFISDVFMSIVVIYCYTFMPIVLLIVSCIVLGTTDLAAVLCVLYEYSVFIHMHGAV